MNKPAPQPERIVRVSVDFFDIFGPVFMAIISAGAIVAMLSCAFQWLTTGPHR